MPGYDQYQKMSREIPGSVKLGSINAQWKEDGTSFEYAWDGKRYRYDVAAKQATVIGDAPAGAAGAFGGRGRGGQGGGQPARGRQFDSAESPDKKLKAFYKDRNLWLSDADGSNAVALTTDGSEKDRIKYGTASWVYGEELAQRTAMWWSPDSRQLAYYRFDEKPVPDFYLQLNQTQVQDTLDVEAYPEAGQAESDRRSLRLRRGDEEAVEDRRARRQAVRQHDRRPLRLQRRVVARRPGDPLQPDQPPQNILEFAACSPRPASAAPSCTRSGRPAGSRTARRCAFSRTASGSSGSRSATASRTSTSTTCPAS